jgi:hypothetical protein
MWCAGKGVASASSSSAGFEPGGGMTALFAEELRKTLPKLMD